MSNPEFFLWCDLETTGLRPKVDSILEMALVITDADFNELGRQNIIFKRTLNFGDFSPEVIEMHTKNGLWLDVINKGIPPYSRINYEISQWIVKTTGLSEWGAWTKIYLAGSSIHFDVGFLRVNNFSFINDVSHRYFDVSVFRTALKMWRPDVLWPQNDTHRAMDDILDHIEEAKHYKRFMLRDWGA